MEKVEKGSKLSKPEAVSIAGPQRLLRHGTPSVRPNGPLFAVSVYSSHSIGQAPGRSPKCHQIRSSVAEASPVSTKCLDLLGLQLVRSISQCSAIKQRPRGILFRQ
jgi:hypothetical protein